MDEFQSDYMRKKYGQNSQSSNDYQFQSNYMRNKYGQNPQNTNGEYEFQSNYMRNKYGKNSQAPQNKSFDNNPVINENSLAATEQNKFDLDYMLQPDVKLDDEQKKIIKTRYNERIKELGGNTGLIKVIPPSVQQDLEFQKLKLLENKINSGSAFTAGVLKSLGLDKFLNFTENKNSNTLLSNTQTQNPFTYFAGNLTGEAAKYNIGGTIMQKIPGVGKALGNAGNKIGNAISGFTNGKIAMDVASKAATGLLGDTILDIGIDTIPNALLPAIQNGKSGNEIAKDVALNVGTNIAYNVGSEALGQIFKKSVNAFKAWKQSKQVTKESAETVAEMAKAFNTLNDAQKTAVANESGFNTAEEMLNEIDSILKNYNSGNLTKQQIESLKPNGINRQAFQDATGIQLPNTSSENVFRINKEAPPAIKTGITVQDGVTGGLGASDINISQAPIDVNIPQGFKERGYSETIRTKITDLPPEVKNSFIDNPEIYQVLTNKETIAKADKVIKSGADLYEQFSDLLKNKDPAAIPLGNELARQYVAQGNSEAASRIVRDLAENLTKSGQFSQAAAISLMQNDPMTALRYIQKEIEKLNILGKKDFKTKWKDFSLTSAEITKLGNLKQGETEGIKTVFDEIGKRIGKEYPVKAWEKIVELSRINMLFNPRTQVKNIVSNFLLKPLTRTSGQVSAVIQNAYKAMGGNITPTQAFFIPKETKAMAAEVWKSVSQNLENVNKYADSIKGGLKEKQVFKEGLVTRIIDNVFPDALENVNKLLGKDKAGFLETLRNATYWMLDAGDKPFVEKNFVTRLGSYMQAQNIKNIADVPEEAITVAYQEALRATFKDDTALSGILSGIKNTKSATWNKAAEMIMPFTKTPANIAMRGIDYSPLGLINTIAKAKNGADAAEIIDELAKNFTGSALIGVGGFLGALGFLTGPEPKNKKQATFLKQQGWKPYSIHIGDAYYSYDWAQPAATPLILGTTMQSTKSDGTTTAVEMFKNAAASAADRWLELSPLQNVKEILGGYGSPSENAINTLMEFPQRFIPSALGATARVLDTTQRVTYSKNDTADTQKNIAASKLPGKSKTLPIAYDTWGNAIKRDANTGAALFNQYLNPGNMSVAKSTAVDKEINRIYEQLGDENIFPRKAAYTITRTIDGVKQNFDLNNVQYSMYQKEMGEKSLQGVEAFINSAAYKTLSDKQRFDIIGNIYKNAKESADYLILNEMNKPASKEEERRIKQVFLDYTPNRIAEYYIAKEIIYNAEGRKNRNGRTINGSVKKAAIDALVEIGYSRGEANRLYRAVRG